MRAVWVLALVAGRPARAPAPARRLLLELAGTAVAEPRGARQPEPLQRLPRQQHEGPVDNDKCLGCHDHNDLQDRIDAGKGFHASAMVKGKACQTCHLEHKGTRLRHHGLEVGRRRREAASTTI